MTTVFTIGYEGLSSDRFLSMLRQNGIQSLADIREMPLSRKPGFSKRALDAQVTAAGMKYLHLRELGCPKPIRDRYRNDGCWRRYREGFLAYLETQHAAIARLAALADESTCALLCYESDFNHCHRSMVAEALSSHCGAAITHLRPTAVRTASPAAFREAFA